MVGVEEDVKVVERKEVAVKEQETLSRRRSGKDCAATKAGRGENEERDKWFGKRRAIGDNLLDVNGIYFVGNRGPTLHCDGGCSTRYHMWYHIATIVGSAY